MITVNPCSGSETQYDMYSSTTDMQWNHSNNNNQLHNMDDPNVSNYITFMARDDSESRPKQEIFTTEYSADTSLREATPPVVMPHPQQSLEMSQDLTLVTGDTVYSTHLAPNAHAESSGSLNLVFTTLAIADIDESGTDQVPCPALHCPRWWRLL